jgi:hypothetical protein
MRLLGWIAMDERAPPSGSHAEDDFVNKFLVVKLIFPTSCYSVSIYGSPFRCRETIKVNLAA